MKRFVFYDTETTGLRPDKDRIIELAAFDPVKNITFCQFINPGIPIPEESTKISNITDEMVKDAPPFSVIGQNFIDFLDEDVILVAHNNDAFDEPFMKEEFSRNQLFFPKVSFIDSLKWARKYRKDLPRHGLQYLREAYKIEANQAHRALDDVIVLYQVFMQMVDDLAPEIILEKVKATTAPLTMPFGKHKGTPLTRLPKDYVKWLQGSGALDKTENESLKNALELLQI